MNKDVIYIEPEDDITDIITKIENSKEKIVALVPPKKAGVFRSVVNIKLIAKSGTSNEKTIVLVTVDPSIVRLAATVKLPVTKDLQSAPMIPTIDALVDEESKAELVEVDNGEGEAEVEAKDKDATEPEEESSDKEEESDDDKTDTDDSDEEKDDKEEEPSKKDKKKAKSKDKADKKAGKAKGGWFKAHKIRLIIAGVGILALAGILVWALVIAPAVDITVWIQTENRRFSEPISFSTNMSEENTAEGKFYLEEKKIESTQEIKFEATGKKNRGERATGELSIMATISHKGGVKVINAGEIFTNNGLSYAADKSLTLAYDGEDSSVCANEDDSQKEFKAKGCQIYAKIKVTATAPGAAYNIGPTNYGWRNVSDDLVVSSDAAMTGGTDDTITVVQQSDVMRAKEQLASANEAENKEKLLSTVGDDAMVLESTFSQTTSEAVATPGIDEEVKEGVTPVLKATTTTSVMVLDKNKLKEFVTAKADLREDQKIYEIDDPFLEALSYNGVNYVARMKTSYSVGPKVDNKEVLDMALGKGIGDLQHDLKSIAGVVSVDTKTSYPWVMKVPSDTNKVSIDIKIKGEDDKQEDNGGDKGVNEDGKEEENKGSE